MIPADTTRSRVRTALATLALAGLVACESPESTSGPTAAPASPAPTPAPVANLAPAIRLVGAAFFTGGGDAIVARGHVTIDDVIRPTFSGAREFLFEPSCTAAEDDASMVECSLEQPIEVDGPEWAVVEANLPEREEPGGHGGPTGDRPEIVTDSFRALVPADPEKAREAGRTVRLPADRKHRFFSRLIPALSERTVVTPEIVLHGGGRLRTWIGLEEASWLPETTPVLFSISLVRVGADEREKLFERVVDPSRPEDRAWIRAEVELPDLGDQAFHLLFETAHPDENDASPALPIWGDPTILRPEKERRRPRHVVLVSLDTLRAKSMSAYGHDRPTTPRFEKMLEEGTLFEKAFTTFSNTLGSHMSMMTGLYPANHRVRASNLNLDGAIPTLAMRMRDAGYETAAFTENALLRASAGFQRGFARYYENTSVEDGAGDAAGTFRRALDWAKAQPDHPLFLFVHTYEVHAPYLPPDETADALGERAMETPPKAASQLDLYEREIVHLDRLLADFVDELASLAPEDELLLVVTADHGEEFMEHGAVLHLQLFDEVMQIPMFLRWPGHVPAGLRIDTPVSLVDLVPTIVELVGGDPLPSDGVSLLPLLEGAEIARDVVFAQTARSSLNDYKSRFVARAGDAKCMVREGSDPEDQSWSACYDLGADPEEKNALDPDSDPAITELHRQAVGYRDHANRHVAGEAPEEVLEAEDEIDPERREKLRMLGYVE